MAQEKGTRGRLSHVSGLYLPTQWVEGGVDADFRSEMYSALHSRPIPKGLIEIVSGFAHHSEVVWLISPQPGQAITDEQYEIIQLLGPESEKGERLNMHGGPPRTASEALAFCLSIELSAYKEMPTSPVRSGGLLPPSTIAYIAFDLLQSYTIAPPGPFLQRLIAELLKIPAISDNELRLRAAKQRAAYIVAQAPNLKADRIAELLEVDRRSIDRWKKDEEFEARVAELRELISSPEWEVRKQNNRAFRWIEV